MTPLPALLLLAALAACSGADPEPKFADETPPTTPTAPVTTSEPVEVPQSARAFLRQWQEEANAMQTSGESSAFRALTLKCASCDIFADNVDRIYAAGGYIKTAGGEVARVTRWGSINDWPTYDVVVNSARSEFQESSSGPLRTLKGGAEIYRVSLLQRGMRWLVTKYGRVAQ